MSDANRGIQKPGGTARPGGFGPGMGPPGMGRGPAEKPKDMKRTVGRLLSYFGPRKKQIGIVLMLAAMSTAFSIVGPKLMGKVTTKLFQGLMGKYAAAMSGQPLSAIDFGYIGRMIAILVALYLFSALLSYLQQYLMSDVSQP